MRSWNLSPYVAAIDDTSVMKSLDHFLPYQDFNDTLTRSRRMLENRLGILANRFRIKKKSIILLL